MIHTRIFPFVLFLLLLGPAVAARGAEVTIGLNEAFFDSLLDAVFQYSSPPEFSIASAAIREGGKPTLANSFAESAACKETIQLLRENNGVRTAVRFRDGKIFTPLAFTGNYNPPFVGCVAFSGYAETLIDLEFDRANQRLIARARVLNVNLNGTGGVGGTVIGRLVQSSIDKRVNPIEIFRVDKLSFPLPVQNGASVKMKANGVRHEIENGLLKIHLSYEFVKG